MVYSVGASQSSPALQDGEKPLINLSHSSSIFQHNYTIRFENTLFLIDQKMEFIVKGLFGVPPSDLASSGFGSPTVLELKGFKYLTSQIVNNILHFFRQGSIELKKSDQEQEASLLQLVKASKRYNFPLLNSYLRDFIWRGSDNPFQENTFLDSLQQLELAALRQHPDMFFHLLDQYLEAKRERSCEIENGEFFIRNFNRLLEEFAEESRKDEIVDRNEGDAWDQKEISRVVIPFEAESFEKMACLLREKHPLLYEQVVAAYAKAHQYCLDDLIHFVADVQLKWALASHISSLDIRMLWFMQLDAEASDKSIERAIIIPLMNHGRLEEALMYAEKAGSQQLIMRVIDALEISLLGLPDDSVEEKIEKVCFDVKIPLRFIRNKVEELVNKTNEMTGVLACRRLVQEFHEAVETHLMEEKKHGWTQHLLVCAIQYYIQKVAEMLVVENVKEIQRKCAVTEYGKQLHPAMMEDLQIIKSLIKTVKKYLDRTFGSSQILSILEDQSECLSEIRVAEALIVHIRHLFQKRFSLREDFIVQEISNYLQPYFFKSDAPVETKPFMERLEEKLGQAKLGGKLSAEEIMMAKEFYIRKGVEVANYRYCHLGVRKLDPYEINNVADLRELKEALQVALQADFSENYLVRLSLDQRRSFEGPVLMREVFVQAINAKFKTLSI